MPRSQRSFTSLSMISNSNLLQKSSSPKFRDQPFLLRRPPSRLFGTVKNNDDHVSMSDSTVRPDIAFILEHYRVHRREKEGTHGSSREYLLLPPDTYVPQIIQDPRLPAAALFAHRNVLFGARSFHGYEMTDVCVPLVRAAIKESEAIESGQQPQAVANLKGLSEWVAASFGNNHEGSQTLKRLTQECEENNDDGRDLVSLEAVRAIATGIPRPGHSVVGQGTFRDGEDTWKELAREYISLGLSEEANLYDKQGGKLVNIEHLADRSAENMKSAGGAMARLFFL